MTYPIPPEVLGNHTAVLGKTGSGKSSTTRLIVEEVVPMDFRVCVLDTLKSDWWGITSSADGQAPGLPFRILGGPRAHIGLPSTAGEAVGRLVAQGKLPLSILDMADFGPGDHQRFFVAFAEALWKHHRGVLYLVVEEAHELAPKEKAGLGAESMSTHWMKKLATGGRSKGIRLIVATQRVQALHNAVLGSCETLIAHRLTLPADQKPVIDWLKANVDKATVEAVSGSLSSLPTGTGWLCSGEARIFQKVAFPKFATFDNTATPTGDADEITVATAAVDHDELRAILGAAVKEVEANDPKALKAEIARLTGEIAQIRKSSPAADPEALKAADAKGYERGYGDGWDRACAAAAARSSHALAVMDRPLEEFSSAKPPAKSNVPPAPAPPRPSSAAPTHAAVVPATPQAVNGHASLSGPQRHLLTALAWWSAMGHAAPTRTQLAAKAGWAPKGSTLRARLSELNSAGLVEYPATGQVRMTDVGRASAPTPDTAETLVGSIRAILSGPQTALFDALHAHGTEMTRADLAVTIGWEPGGSTLRARLSELHQLELVEYPARGSVQLQAWVTE